MSLISLAPLREHALQLHNLDFGLRGHKGLTTLNANYFLALFTASTAILALPNKAA
jgi:hypothetical protein